MKETQIYSLEPTQSTIQVEPKKSTYLGSKTPHKGHSLFCLDPHTKKISLVNKQDTSVHVIKGKAQIRSKVICDPDKYYCFALNKKNAEKIFKRMLAY